MSTSLFAYTPPIVQIDSVDLSNDSVDNYRCLDNHNASEELENEFQLSYSKNQVITSIKLEADDLDNGGTITFDFGGLNFNCTDNKNISRPYGIELVFWQRWKINGSSKNFTVAGYKALGSGHINASDTGFSFEIPAGSSKEAIATIIKNNRDLRRAYFWYRIWFPKYWFEPLDDFIDFIVEQNETYLEEGYIDVVLVLPELTFEQEKQMVYSDNYSASFTVNNGEPITFTGYYRKNNNPLVFKLEVNCNENTKSIELNSDDISSSDKNGLQIGSYRYSAEFVNDQDNTPTLKYYSFVSSSADPATPNGKFVLVDANEENEIEYQIGLTNGSNSTKWYTGDMTVQLGEGVDNNKNSLLAGASGFTISGDKITIKDSGNILFKLTESSDNRYEIPPGTYSSNIYFHVIANL